MTKRRARPGPVSLFRGKIRKPTSLTLTAKHHAALRRARARLGLTQADVIALLIDRFAHVVEIPHTHTHEKTKK